MSRFENEYRVERVPQHRMGDSKWVVSVNGTYVEGFQTKKSAVRYARQVAKRNMPSNLVIEYEGGGIANKIEY